MTEYKVISVREEIEDILIRNWYVTVNSPDGKTCLNTYISHCDKCDDDDYSAGDIIVAEHTIHVEGHKKVDPGTELSVNQLRNQDLFSFGEIKAVVEIRKIYNKRFAYALSSISSDEILLEFRGPTDYRVGDKIMVVGGILLENVQRLVQHYDFTINSIFSNAYDRFFNLKFSDGKTVFEAHFLDYDWYDGEGTCGWNVGDQITAELSFEYIVDESDHKKVDRDTELSFIPHSRQCAAQAVVEVCQIIDEFDLYAFCLIASDTLVKVRVCFERAVNYKVGDRIWVRCSPELDNVKLVKAANS